MRWSTTPRPEEGATRIRQRFALLPTKIGPHMVWLEHFAVEEKYHRSGEGDWWQELNCWVVAKAGDA